MLYKLCIPRLKYWLTSIMFLSINLTSYCRAPCRISCMMSGTNPPSHTWKYLAYKINKQQVYSCYYALMVTHRSSLRCEFLLIPYSFEASVWSSSCAQCYWCVLGSLRIKSASLNFKYRITTLLLDTANLVKAHNIGHNIFGIPQQD